jgi:hypothetical protein
MSLRDHLAALHRDLGLRRLNAVWAKLEIFLGLTSAACGLLLGIWAIQRLSLEAAWQWLAASVALQVLGVYLALAGHRSHLYQSQNKLTAYVAMLLKSQEFDTAQAQNHTTDSHG